MHLRHFFSVGLLITTSKINAIESGLLISGILAHAPLDNVYIFVLFVTILSLSKGILSDIFSIRQDHQDYKGF